MKTYDAGDRVMARFFGQTVSAKVVKKFGFGFFTWYLVEYLTHWDVGDPAYLASSWKHRSKLYQS